MRLIERRLTAQIAVLIFALSLVSSFAAGQAAPAAPAATPICGRNSAVYRSLQARAALLDMPLMRFLYAARSRPRYIKP